MREILRILRSKIYRSRTHHALKNIQTACTRASKENGISMGTSCRVCFGVAQRTHSTAIFSTAINSSNWPLRLNKLLLLDIQEGDGLGGRVCRTCTGKVASIESRLESLRSVAKETDTKLRATLSSRKRPKTTGDLLVSPDTAAARPSAKRYPAGVRRSLFASNSGIYNT